MKYRIFSTILLVAVLAAAFVVSNQHPAAQVSGSVQTESTAPTASPAAQNSENAALTGMKIN